MRSTYRHFAYKALNNTELHIEYYKKGIYQSPVYRKVLYMQSALHTTPLTAPLRCRTGAVVLGVFGGERARATPVPTALHDRPALLF